ncbi:hypothetical protein [Mesorhizobium sp. SARCC-RB16n]|uniref:hypothetical protein n=1 Tax=Mesorhizobium sp. SARCC-RB16n TaxID=2116687 RepID=UPI00166C8C62|nr:hypothetical protein [Mesorhizobium sp. SARCC-RB16n]
MAPVVRDDFGYHSRRWQRFYTSSGGRRTIGVAYWFAPVNSFLRGEKPQELLISEPEHLVRAAEDEVAGVVHG